MKKTYFYDGKEYSFEELKKRFSLSISRIKEGKAERGINTLKMIEGKDVLDVGCAGGDLSKQIAEMGFSVHGIDVLESSIEIANDFHKLENTTYEVRDVLKQPFPPNSFDCITFLETIEHVENPALFLKEFHRILRPNGCLILSTPNATSLKNIIYALSYRRVSKRKKIAKEISEEPKSTGTQIEHISNWDFPTLVRLLDRCGFELVDHVFVRSGPIVIPFFGKKIKIIGDNSKILSSFEPLMTTHIMKAKKRAN